MTKQYPFSKIREAHNELEAFLRIKGTSIRQFARLLDVSEVTAKIYMLTPTLMRYSHLKKIAVNFEMTVCDVVDIIEYDLK